VTPSKVLARGEIKHRPLIGINHSTTRGGAPTYEPEPSFQSMVPVKQWPRMAHAP
jgi:hypothetical protein